MDNMYSDSGPTEQATAEQEIIDIEDIVNPFIPSSKPEMDTGTSSTTESDLTENVSTQNKRRGRKPKDIDETEDPKLDKRRQQKRESARNCRGKVREQFQVLKQKNVSLKSERDRKRKQVYKLKALKSYFKSYLVTFKSMLGVATFSSPTTTTKLAMFDSMAQTKKASVVVSAQQKASLASLSDSNMQTVTSGSAQGCRPDSGNSCLPPAPDHARISSQAGAGHVTDGSALSAAQQPHGSHDLIWQDMGDNSNLTSAASPWADAPTSFAETDIEFPREMLTAADLTAWMTTPERSSTLAHDRDLDKDLLRFLAPISDYPVQDFMEDELYGRRTVGSPAAGVADLEELSALLASDTPFT